MASKLKGKVWADIHNDPLAVAALAPLIAHQLYPELFPTPHSFTGEFKGWLKSQDQQIEEMLDIVREKSGKQYIVFVIDEVGQYVAARTNLILNLDGLAKNLKRLGNDKVWIIGTAQQTLTEDDPRASLNSPQLFKLKAFDNPENNDLNSPISHLGANGSRAHRSNSSGLAEPCARQGRGCRISDYGSAHFESRSGVTGRPGRRCLPCEQFAPRGGA